MLIPRSLVVPEGAATRTPRPCRLGSGTPVRARHAIASGPELTGGGDGLPSPAMTQQRQPARPPPPIPVGGTGLRGDWGPAHGLAWDQPASPAH